MAGVRFGLRAGDCFGGFAETRPAGSPRRNLARAAVTAKKPLWILDG